jgi:hypothetical protein
VKIYPNTKERRNVNKERKKERREETKKEKNTPEAISHHLLDHVHDEDIAIVLDCLVVVLDDLQLLLHAGGNEGLGQGDDPLPASVATQKGKET